jgi:hypothetical protein
MNEPSSSFDPVEELVDSFLESWRTHLIHRRRTMPE